MGLRYVPMCFTEQGVAMLSSVLKSEQAIKVNIQIIRVFTKLRSLLFDNTEVRLEIEQIKKKWKTTEKISNWFFSTWMNFWKNRKPKKRERKSAIKSNRIPSDCFLP
jgi:hypothetical protein